MAWQMGYGGFIDAASGIDVDGIYGFRQHLRGFIRPTMLRLVLSSWREEETSIWREGQSAEE